MSNEVRSLARSDRYTDTHASQAGSAQWCRDVATALRCGPGPARVAGLHSRVCLPHAHAPGAAWGLASEKGPVASCHAGIPFPLSLLGARVSCPISTCGRWLGRGPEGQLPPFLIQLGPVLLRSLVECRGRTVVGAPSTLQLHSVTPAIGVEST